MKDLIIYAAPVITFGLGYLFGRDKADNWRIDAEKWKKASQTWEEILQDWNATSRQGIKDMADSQSRLADALAAKNERLERIIAKGRESKSGSAQHLAKIAAGEAK